LIISTEALANVMNKDEINNGLILGGGTVIALLVIVLAFLLTKPRIDKTQQEQLATYLEQLLVADSYNNNPSSDVIKLTHSALGSDQPLPVYRALYNDKPTGAVITAIAPDGYSGAIHLLIGVSVAGDIVAVRVTDHKETPGLGDDIDKRKSDWIDAFDDLSPSTMQVQDWQVKKDGGQFDQFTGATITPRAVIQSVYNVAQWYSDNQQSVYAQITESVVDKSELTR